MTHCTPCLGNIESRLWALLLISSIGAAGCLATRQMLLQRVKHISACLMGMLLASSFVQCPEEHLGPTVKVLLLQVHHPQLLYHMILLVCVQAGAQHVHDYRLAVQKSVRHAERPQSRGRGRRYPLLVSVLLICLNAMCLIAPCSEIFKQACVLQKLLEVFILCLLQLHVT